MEKLNNTAKELEEILGTLKSIDFCMLYSKTDQVGAVANMIRTFIDCLPDEVPREKEILDGFFALSSVLETLSAEIEDFEDKIMNVTSRLSDII